MSTTQDIIKHVLDDCIMFYSDIESYEYCDRIPFCCCSMTKLAYDMILGGDYL